MVLSLPYSFPQSASGSHIAVYSQLESKHLPAACIPVRDNDNLKSHKYVCITTYQPDTKSNPNPNPNPNPTTKQHAIVNIELNTITRATYPEKFIRDNVVAPFVPTSIVIVTLPMFTARLRLGYYLLECLCDSTMQRIATQQVRPTTLREL